MQYPVSDVPGVSSLGEVLSVPLDCDRRAQGTQEDNEGRLRGGTKGDYRVRSPTRSERLNRALKELSPSAFKIHILLWKWRGAPAKGSLPYFTIHSLGKFCGLSRPTVRSGLSELTTKGWIRRNKYNSHFKNALYSLVPIRRVPRPPGC